ncbi:MAG TPA: hypothetical protein VFN57_09490 [Thermomicrobiaceae bacterium]|nr:hypothetical protein [Thermomicrobiaceae bacterium]
MNLVDALDRVRDRLEENGARPETFKLVETIRRTAAQPGADQAQVRSQLELIRRLMRTPVAHANVGVYDDLATLERQFEEASIEAAARREAEESKPLPKSKKYYKELKQRDRKP